MTQEIFTLTLLRLNIFKFCKLYGEVNWLIHKGTAHYLQSTAATLMFKGTVATYCPKYCCSSKVLLLVQSTAARLKYCCSKVLFMQSTTVFR